MVGVPRSKGCQTCVSRRVKCDETRPACSKCQKYGVDCPGYDKVIKFVSQKHQIRQRGKGTGQKDEFLTIRKKSPSDSDSSPYSSFQINSPTSLETQLSSDGCSDGSLNSPSVIEISRQNPPPLMEYTPLHIAMMAAPSPNRAQYIGTMVQHLQRDMGQYDTLSIFHWIPLERLGAKSAMDGAMCSLAMHLLGKELNDSYLLGNSRTLYGQSLTALQSALLHPTEWKSSETLCSAILLCTFELFAGTSSPETWLKHARGIGVLMEQRGPAAHTEGFDAAMALSFRGTLIMSDLFYPTRDRCFLAEPKWRDVLNDGGRYLVYPPHVPPEAILVVDEYFHHLADIPEVLIKGFTLREKMENGGEIDWKGVGAIIELASRRREAFKLWRERCIKEIPLSVPEETISEDPESPHLFVYKYESPWYGSLGMSYWASMLILQETLIQCQVRVEELREDQKELVLNILRSIEDVGKGTLGPQRVGYPVRIAYEFAEVKSQEWIRKVLDGFKKTYAATDKATYPQLRVDGSGYS